MYSSKILIVDDEKLIQWSLKQSLSQEGYEVITAGEGKEALKIIPEHWPDLVLLDLKLPDVSGIEVLEKIKQIDKDTLVIMITAHGPVETVVRALKAGAYDYVSKPFDLDELKLTIKKALETMALRREITILKGQQQKEFGFDSIIGQSPAMQEIFKMITRVAKNDATTVLLQGESGTGKDLVAKVIHYSSDRKDKPFMEVNCTALPETLLESELLGHEKGAFTDAKMQKMGLFELAEAGTILLDEIGDIKLSMQVKLLRIIEDKTFKRIGGTRDIKVNVRIIAASNKDLEKAVKEGEFRPDLYYRLKIIPITLPPLRRRGEDILLLAKFFIDNFNREFKKNIKGISREAEQLLLAYHWPGNVRELRNVIERAIILQDTEVIMAEHLPLEIHKGKAAVSGEEKKTVDIKLPAEGLSLVSVETELVRQALQRTGGNQTRAAKLLGLNRDVLRYRMKKFGLGKESMS